MSATGDGTPVPVVKRAPREREQVLAAKRAELVASGSVSLAGFDAVRDELRGQERRTLDGLARQAGLVVASWCSEHAEDLSLLPATISQGLIVRATVAYLYGYGLMKPVEGDQADWHVLEWKDAVPEHLWPDAEQALRGYSRMLSALGQVHPVFGETVPVGTPPVERA